MRISDWSSDVCSSDLPIVMQLSRTEDGEDTFAPHVNEVAAAAATLLASCSAELALAMEPQNLADFPGFPESSAMAAGGLALGKVQKLLVQPVRATSNNCLAVTGDLPHYLH